MSDHDRDGPPRGVMLAAVLLAVAAAVAVLIIAARHDNAPPVPVAAVSASQAAGAECTSLLAALPDRLGDFRRAELATPAPAGTAAWRIGADEPVILRCGLDRPGDFVVGTPLQLVDKVSWFRVAEADRATWFAVDRPVYIALTLPADSGPAPIQALSSVIAATLPERPIDPGAPR